MTAAMLSAIATNEISFFWLVELQFSTVLYMTNCWKDIDFGGNTYSAVGNLLGIDNIPEDLELNVSTVKVKLSGANQANIAAALTGNYTDTPVLIHVGLFDANDDVIADPVQVYEGRITNFNLIDDFEAEESEVTWNIANHFSDFDKTSGRRANREDQALHFPTDTGLNHMAEIVKELTWGKL